MRSALHIIFFVYVTFILESVLSQLVGRWLQPDLLLMLIVFFNLFRGIRCSLFAAVCAGLLRDSFSAQAFGLNTFSLCACAFLTTYIKLYVYHVGSAPTRVLLVVVMTVVHVMVRFIVNIVFVPLSFSEVFRYVLIPQVVIASITANYFFARFKKCALKFFA